MTMKKIKLNSSALFAGASSVPYTPRLRNRKSQRFFSSGAPAICATLCAVGALLFATSAQAALIVTNGDFQSTVSADGTIPGWYAQINGATQAGHPGNTQLRVDSNTTFGVSPDDYGTQVGNLRVKSGSTAVWAYQPIGTIADLGSANALEINFDLLQWATRPFGSVEASIWFGGDNAPADGTDLDNVAIGATQQWTSDALDPMTTSVAEQHSISLTTGALNVGSFASTDIVWLRFLGTNVTGGNKDNGIDNVTVTAIPEPSTFALFAGALGLALVMVRRRRA